MVPNLFQQLSTGLCPSVASYFRELTYGAIVFPSGSEFQRGFHDYEVLIDANSERRLSACVRRDEEALTFRRSRHIPAASVFVREADGQTLATAVARCDKSLRLFSIAASISRSPSADELHLFALALPKYEGIVFQFSNEAGLREADFVTFPQVDVETVTVESNLWRGHRLVCPLTTHPNLAGMLRAAGLDGATDLELQGFFVTSLRAAARGLRLVFKRGNEILHELPGRDALGL